MEKFLSLKKIIWKYFVLDLWFINILFVHGASDQGFIVHLFKLF